MNYLPAAKSFHNGDRLLKPGTREWSYPLVAAGAKSVFLEHGHQQHLEPFLLDDKEFHVNQKNKLGHMIGHSLQYLGPMKIRINFKQLKH